MQNRPSKELADQALLRDLADLQHAQTDHGVDLEKACLFETDLSHQDLTRANLIQAIVLGAHLEDLTLFEADLCDALLIDTDLSRADLREADLSGAFLWRTRLASADLRGTLLLDAELIDVDLSDANLIGTDLSGARLLNVNLSGALHDGTTCWPADGGATSSREAPRVPPSSGLISMAVKGPLSQ